MQFSVSSVLSVFSVVSFLEQGFLVHGVMYTIDDPVVSVAVEALAAQFVARFRSQITRPRIVGREAEFPVVNAAGQAADVRRLWEPLMERGDLRPKYDSGSRNLIVALDGENYSYALEVGVGTVEINTRPCHDLWTVKTLTEEAVSRLVRAAARRGWQVLGYGIQPVTRASLRLMSPKQRYQSLYRAMGEEWLWYTVTASDQVQIDIGREEMVLMLNFGNLIAPVLIALCANSPVYEGEISPYCSGREGRMARIHAGEHRHGMPARPYASIADYVRTVSQAQFLILRDQYEVVPSSQLFTQYLREHGPDFDAFLFHEHYIWNSARLRVAYGTIELRPACQQPWREHMAAAALGLGLIEAAEPVYAYIQEELGEDYWGIMRTYHRQVIARGLAAPQPAPHFLRRMVEMAQAGLRQRGFGEEQLLGSIFGRLQRQENPAQHIRRIFRTDGLHRVLTESAIRPAVTRPERV
jgi:gamma-glutamylcysteine synthetase